MIALMIGLQILSQGLKNLKVRPGKSLLTSISRLDKGKKYLYVRVQQLNLKGKKAK